MEKIKNILTIVLLSSSSICIILITIQIISSGVNLNINDDQGIIIKLDGDLTIGSSVMMEAEEEFLKDSGMKYRPLKIIE